MAVESLFPLRKDILLGCSYLLQYLTPAVLILLTRKRSILRFLWIPCAAYVAYGQYLLACQSSPSPVSNAMRAGSGVVCAIQAANLLTINPLDTEELLRNKIFEPSSSFLSRFIKTCGLFADSRATNTPWQAKNITHHAAFFTRRGVSRPHRGIYLCRQLLIIAWQYLIIDLYCDLGRPAMGDMTQGRKPLSEYHYLNVSLEEWGVRVLVTVLQWFIVGRLTLDSMFRGLAAAFVGMGLSTPDDWPPVFGSMWDAYTLRNFWGKFWHQMLRWPFQSVSSFLARDVLRLPRPSILERYTNIFFVFAISGLMHTLCDMGMGIPYEYAAAFQYYTSFPLAIMVEDGVQELWKRITTRQQEAAKPGHAARGGEGDTPLWRKIVGYVWVMLFLSMVTPRHVYYHQFIENINVGLIPFSFIERIGVRAAGIAAVVGGILLKFGFGAEE